MAVEIIIPHVGETTRRVKINRWLKQEGDFVRKNEPILEIETDKANLVIESFGEGILDSILVPAGEEANAMQVVGLLRGEGEQPVQRPATASPATESVQVPPASPRPRQAGGRNISPRARRLAAEHGLNPDTIEGSGPDGLITVEDVEKAAQTAKGAGSLGAAETLPLTRMREAIAQRMVQSKTTIPHFYVATQVNMEHAVALRDALAAGLAPNQARPTFTHLLVRAIALAARQHPGVNATFTERGVVRHGEVNVGIAVELPDGLVVPVVKKADDKGVDRIAAEAADLVARARKGGLRGDELTGGTITLSNLKGYDVEMFAAIINPPESVIIAAGDIAPRPVVVDGAVVAKPTMHIVGSGDHRVLDGAALARFLQTVKQLLENPYRLLV